MTEIRFTTAAKNQLSTLEKDVRLRIYKKLDNAVSMPHHYLKPLTAYTYFSLRVGDHRIIIDWQKNRDELWVVAVGHRKNIYE